jgi:DNA invertase Pin-like site-specific DNA recombinase
MIKNVAIYLRKSRGEEATVLEKHRRELVEFCKKHEWAYVEYAEVGTSDSIDERPQMLRLLRDVKNEDYDAVIVMDYDRTGRGSAGDRERIQEVFAMSQTLLITCDDNRVIDFTNDIDLAMAEFQGLFARQEYRTIKKRLSRGKRLGAKLGFWTNGIPPFPYQYNPETKKLKVREENLSIYRFMIESYLKGMPFHKISWELNRMKVPSPKGLFWQDNTVRRIIYDETHLGRIIYGKTEGSYSKKKKGKKFRNKPYEEWIIVENCHPAVKTIEEHEKIMSLAKRKKKIPKTGTSSVHPLSGLIKCAVCEHRMSFVRDNNGDLRIRSCRHTDPYGNICRNQGGDPDVIMQVISKELKEYEQKLLCNINSNNDREIAYLEEKILQVQKAVKKIQGKISRIYESYEDGIYTKEVFLRQREKAEKDLGALHSEISNLKMQQKNIESMDPQERLERVRRVLNHLDEELSTQQYNQLLNTVIDNVLWKREGNQIEVEINFLQDTNEATFHS